MQGKQGDVKDPSLVNEGIRLIDWAAREMQVTKLIKERFEKESRPNDSWRWAW